MSDEIQVSNIQQIETEIILLKNQTAQNIIEIGKRLNEAKELLPHGEWGKWLEEKVEFSQRNANNFMRVAKEFSNSQTYSNLTQSKIFALLDIPQEEREEFIENNPVEDMTTRELQKVIKEKKELERKIKELENQEPTVVEKEKIIEVVPEDYEEIKNKLKNTVDKYNFNRLRDEFEEKTNENFELKQQIKQLSKTDSKERHREKLKDNTLIFCNRIHTFLNDVGGLAWLTEYVEELEDYDKRSYYKALDLLEGWVLTVKSNIDKERN